MKWLIITKEPASPAFVEVFADACETAPSGALQLTKIFGGGKDGTKPYVCAVFAPGTWITASAEDVAAEVRGIR